MEHLGFGSLWLQVILVTIATFVASAIFWTVMPWHDTEMKPLPNEDAVRQVLHEQGVTQGQWRIPGFRSHAEGQSPEARQRYMTGPVGIIQLEKPGGIAMGPRLLKTFAYFFVIAFLTAYVLRHAFLPGAECTMVARVACCTAFMAHALGHVQDAIWFGKSWKRVLFQALDSVVYAVITAAIFATMWPDA